LVDNQLRTAEALGRLGVAKIMGWHEDVQPEEIAAAAAALWADNKRLAEMSQRGQQLVDGQGAERVAREIAHEIDSRY
jgi:spore coat polysaccharide biosynthesis predicted glycosyltransferase SpsG